MEQNFDYGAYSLIFKALSHPTRLQMAELLSENVCCVTDVKDTLKISQPIASQHLLTLKNCGVVYPTRHGTRTCYMISNDFVRQVIQLMRVQKN